MDSNASQNEELYRAAVGESKAEYYVPLFYRFDQPGASRLSWNWPAFFVTFFWLLYRRMYALAFGYLIVWPIALLIVFTLVGMLLGQTMAALVYLLLGFGVPFIAAPMFANSIYHWQVRQRIDRLSATASSHAALLERVIGQGSTANGAVIVAVVGFCGVSLLGLLAGIAVPAYQDYTIRSQVTEGLALAAPVKASIADAYSTTGKWPTDLQGMANPASRYVSSIDVSDDGVILISYGKAAHSKIAGHTLSLHPGIQGEQVVEWACGYAAGEAARTDIAAKYLPSACRAPQTQRL
jgi:Tfp pilus assembly major pilin PilA